MDGQFEVKVWDAVELRFECYGLYQRIDDAINAGVERFKNNRTLFDVYKGRHKVCSVRYRIGVVTSENQPIHYVVWCVTR